MTVAKRLGATITLAGALAVGAAVDSAATAAADPAPPTPADPAVPAPPPGPPPSMIGTALAEAAQPGGPGWLSQSGGSGAPPDFLLSQYPVPAIPGSQPAVGLDSSALNAGSYLFGPNFMLSEQGEQSMYSVGPTDPNAPPPAGRIDAFKRAHGLWHTVMGKLDQNQLGEPLPGTAPPPGTNIPAGLGQNLPDESAVPPPVPPPPGG